MECRRRLAMRILSVRLSVCLSKACIVTKRKKICPVQIFSKRELMFTFAICRLPPVCLSSVTFVHPTQVIEIFGNVSTPFGTLAICDPLVKILRDRPRETPPSGG